MTFFDNFTNDSRLLIIHPNYRLQKHALASLLDTESLVYVRFDGEHLSADELAEQVYHAYEKTTASRIDLVVLDECDRAKQADFDEFLRDFLWHINPIPIVVISRDLPSLVLQDPQVRAITSIWPVNPKLMFPDFLKERKTTLLEVFAFAEGYVRVNGVRIEAWIDEHSRELFFFLIDRKRIHRQVIFETFWPQLDYRSAANAFQTVKSNINHQLGIEITNYHHPYYSINSEIELYYDVTQYLNVVQEADFALLQSPTQLYQDANSLYSGQFLNSFESEWVKERRTELQAIQADVLANIAKEELKKGNQNHALLYFGQAARLAAQREDIAFELMRLYLQFQMPCEALAAYNRLEDALSNRGIVPNQNLMFLEAYAQQNCT